MCAICNTDESNDAFIWYGCDECPKWYHRHCIEPDYRAVGDMSLMGIGVLFVCADCQANSSPTCEACGKEESPFMSIWRLCGICGSYYHSSCMADDRDYGCPKNIEQGWVCPSCDIEC